MKYDLLILNFLKGLILLNDKPPGRVRTYPLPCYTSTAPDPLKYSYVFRNDTWHQLHYLAYYDTLTGCYNRNMLDKMRFELDEKDCLVIMIDVDNLKETNTAEGHAGGDRRLKELAKKLGDSFYRMYRVGGDEFMIITESSTRNPGHRLKALNEFFQKFKGISYGIYYKTMDETIDSAMHNADMAMYEMKKKKNVEAK